MTITTIISQLETTITGIDEKIERLNLEFSSVDEERKIKIQEIRTECEQRISEINNLYNETTNVLKSDVRDARAERDRIQRAIISLSGTVAQTPTLVKKKGPSQEVMVEMIRDAIVSLLFINKHTGMTPDEIFEALRKREVLESTQTVTAMGGILGSMSNKAIIYKTGAKYFLTEERMGVERVGLRNSMLEILQQAGTKLTVDDIVVKLKSLKGVTVPKQRTVLRGMLFGLSQGKRVTRSSENDIEYYRIGGCK